MVVRNANIHNIMGGMESTGGVRLHNHRRKLKQRFDIIRKLGQGTYGKVQLGINKETGQEVAIKTIKKAKIETEADLIRIRREIQIMSSVQHPNIIHIYEVFENREKMVLVMEYAAGGELYDYLSERKVLQQDEARRIFRQIATAVYYCHKHKICHRDLKLENILLDEHGSAKIADFGLSNVFDEQRLLNTFCGSPLYASPEIVKGTPYHGPEVDCWSLGVLLYTLVYGAMPFDGSNFKRLVKQISQGDYFEPKKPSPASSLIREMLTVSPARRADIEKVCSHWWVNEGYSDSCLQIAEELADQTPVRLDLLLSLAPPPSGVGTDNIMQQGMNNVPSVPHAMVPTRCHSVGSLMELDHTSTEQQQQQRTFGKQSLYGDNGSNCAQSAVCAAAGHWDSTKRKLEEGSSSSEVNLKGAVKRDRGKRRSCEDGAEASLLPGRSKRSGENEIEEKVSPKIDQEVEKMDTEEIGDNTYHGITHLPELMESSMQSKDSGVETQEDTINTTSEMGTTCKSSTMSSTATIVPTEDSSSAIISSPEEQTTNEPAVTEASSIKNKKSPKKKRDSVSDLKMGGDSPKDLERSHSEATNEKNDSTLPKEAPKSSDSTKDKLKKSIGTETNEIGKSSKNSTSKDIDSGNSKISKTTESASSSSKLSNESVVVHDENEVHKTSNKNLKSKGDSPLENLSSTSEMTSLSDSSTPPSSTIERRRSKIFETADKFNNILSGSPETKNGARDKPKKLFIPGVKVSDFKKAFERKLSSPEISVSSFSKKHPTKSEELTPEKSEKSQNNENSETNLNITQKVVNQVNEGADIKEKVSGSLEGDQVQEDAKGKKQKSAGRSFTHIVADDNKKENVSDLNKLKVSKSSGDSKKHVKSVINKPSDSTPEGNIALDSSQPIVSPEELSSLTEGKTKIESNKAHDMQKCEKKEMQTDNSFSTLDNGNEFSTKIPSKPNDTTGKKKLSKVEITLKSATLPRRKTSKAEIKLDPAVPPIEYKTEIEHMVSAPTTVPLPTRHVSEDYSVPSTAPPFRSWSLEPESSHQSKMTTRECIIPIQIEREVKENPNLTSPPVGRPPAYPFQQRSMSQTQSRSGNLSRQSTQESDSEVMEPIRKSPREYIIPIAVEGGGYVTPRAGSLEPSASDDVKSKQKPMTSARSNHYRRMSSLLSDTSEDEGFNMSPVGLQRHGSLSRGRDDGRTFHFHRLRSSRPMRHSLERNDSLSSAEEDDDDDDDEGFEILTAESLFSTLLSRVRSLTQRLTVEDGKRPGFPSNHFVNQLTNISHPSTSFKNFYSHHREPLSRRLSETSSFPRLINRGDFGPMHQRSLSRDSSNCDSVNSESSCNVGTFPRGSANQKYNPCDNIRRGTRNLPTSHQHASSVPRGGGWQNKHTDESNYSNPYLFLESSVKKSSSSGKNMCRSPSHCNQNQTCNSPRKLARTFSLRSAVEDKLLCDSPLEGTAFSKYSGLLGERHNPVIDSPLPVDAYSSVPGCRKSKEKLRSLSRQNLATVSRDFKSQDSLSGSILPPLPQGTLSENKCNNIQRPIHSASRTQGQDLSGNRQWRMRNTYIDNYQHQPKHSSSLPSIVEGPKNSKFKGNIDKPNIQWNQSESRTPRDHVAASGAEIKKRDDKLPDHTENMSNDQSFIPNNSQNDTNAFPVGLDGMKLFQNHNAENTKQMNSSLKKESVSQPQSSKSEKRSMIPKSSSPVKQEISNDNTSAPAVTDKDDSSTVQKRKISRFLRPDFFDTPPEESTYVREREAKKAAEAEIKKAKRLARRTSSMREASVSKTETQDKNTANVSEGHATANKRNSKSLITNNTRPENHITNSEEHTERIKSNLKSSGSLTSHAEDKNNKNQLWCSSPQKSDSLRTSGSGFCSSAKSRVGKAISSLQEHNFSPWDRKIVATESTYLKRAVSVDDVSLKSQRSLSKSNPKLGRKISSVLGLFSKMENPSLENQCQSTALQTSNDGVSGRINCEQNYLQSEQKTGTLSKTSSEKIKNKLEETKKTSNGNTGVSETDTSAKSTRPCKSLKDSKNKHEVKRNTRKGAAQVISDAISNTKESLKKNSLLKNDSKNVKNGNTLPGKYDQSPIDASCGVEESNKIFVPPDLSKLPDPVCTVPDLSECVLDEKIHNTEQSVFTEDDEKLCIDALKENTFLAPSNFDYSSNLAHINSENSPADETESVDSSCACSDTDGLDNLASMQGDNDEKGIESVEDRIRRKSFYSRFNDVKKKGRKKSSQFLKDSKTSLLPSNYHKNNENQAFPPQNSNTGVISRKSPITSPTTETHNSVGDINHNVSPNNHHNSLQVINKCDELCDSNGKEISSPGPNTILSNFPIETNDGPVNTCALVRPAVFTQGVLKKASPVKSKASIQSKEGGTSIPKLSKPVSGACNAVISDENTSQKSQEPTS